MWSRNLAKYGLVVGLWAGQATAMALAADNAGDGASQSHFTSERYLSDPMTGLALGGYDPVAYFTDDAALLGKPEYELYMLGTVWRFANEGNMQAFREAPDVYAPRYGGYGALLVSRGYAGVASPRIWAVHDNRLYLFASPVHRTIWLRYAELLTREADRHWPEVEKKLPK